MRHELLKLIDSFGESLTSYEYNQYIPKLRDYFVSYIETNYADYNLKEIFQNEFTKTDVINSSIYYVENNTNVQRISAIDDYLIALNRLFDELLFIKFPNPTLIQLKPFKSLSKIVKNKLEDLNISLLDKEAYPPINDEQCDYILNYLKIQNPARLSSYQVPIIIKLMILYGFSHDKIAQFKIKNYNSTRNILKIENTSDKRKVVFIELPYVLKEQLIKYLDFRVSNTRWDSDLLFITEENNEIKNGFTKKVLDKIKAKFESDSNIEFDRNPFTPTGIQKYAIIKMVLQGFNQTIISDFTGQMDDILSDCQRIVAQEEAIERNRYINHMIRGIITYDKL